MEAFYMKAIGNVLKVLAALAAIAGMVYVIVTYGDRIVAWTKKMVSKYCCFCDAPAEVCSEETPEAEVPADAVAAEDFEPNE